MKDSIKNGMSYRDIRELAQKAPTLECAAFDEGPNEGKLGFAWRLNGVGQKIVSVSKSVWNLVFHLGIR